MTRDATAYVTHAPCWTCTKLLLSAGVGRIIYGAAYRLDERIAPACHASDVELDRLNVGGA